MYICDNCGEVFTESACDLAGDRCPTCKSGAYDTAVRCKGCGEWTSREEAYGYHHKLYCMDCLKEYKDDIDFLVKATEDTLEIEIQMLYRYIFSDSDIKAILFRAAKERQKEGTFDAIDFITDYANDIAYAIAEEENDEHRES